MATVVFSAVAELIVLVVVVALDVAFPSPKTKDASPRKKRTERPFANSQRRKTRSNDKVPALQYCDFACFVVCAQDRHGEYRSCCSLQTSKLTFGACQPTLHMVTGQETADFVGALVGGSAVLVVVVVVATSLKT